MKLVKNQSVFKNVMKKICKPTGEYFILPNVELISGPTKSLQRDWQPSTIT